MTVHVFVLEPCHLSGMRAAYGMFEPLEIGSFVLDCDETLWVVLSKELQSHGQSWDHVLRPATDVETLAYEVMDS